MRIFLSAIFFLVGAGVAGVAVNDFYGLSERLSPTSWGDTNNVSILLAVCAGLSWLCAGVLAGRASAWRHQIHDADAALSRLKLDRESASDTRETFRVFREGLQKEPVASVADSLDGVRHDAVAEKAKAFRERVDATIRGADPDLFRAIAAAERKVVSRSKNAAKEARKKVQEVSEALKKRQSKRDRVQSEIREYQKQDGRRAELEEKNAQLRREGTEVREEMDVHHLAQELLGETVDSIRHRAGPSLGKGIRRLLPFLTDDRYQDLQVTPEFELKLFTGAKSDFLATHELSGGTLEGLSFGFRLSFAQAFVGAVTRAPQFLFLDEPFRAMDRGRVRRTLEALHRLSDELPQVIVVLPDVDAEDRAVFDMVIETDVGTPELVRSLDDVPALPAPAKASAKENSPHATSGSAGDPGASRGRDASPVAPPRELPPGVSTRGLKTADADRAELPAEQAPDEKPHADRSLRTRDRAPRSGRARSSIEESAEERRPTREESPESDRREDRSRRGRRSREDSAPERDSEARGRSGAPRRGGSKPADSRSDDRKRDRDHDREGREPRGERKRRDDVPPRRERAPRDRSREERPERDRASEDRSRPDRPRRDRSKDSSRSETPRSETPRSETPRSETPRSETPRSETPRSETRSETPRSETPRSETPRSETPRSERPSRGREEFARGKYARSEDSPPESPRKDRAKDMQAIEEEIRHRETRPLAERAGHRAQKDAEPSAPPQAKKSSPEAPAFAGGGDWPAPNPSAAKPAVKQSAAKQPRPKQPPQKAPAPEASAPKAAAAVEAPRREVDVAPSKQEREQRVSEKPKPARPAAPPQETRRAPGKVRDDAAESPSGFLAGIFDADDSNS